jgi:hypothetical protein
MVTSDAFLNAGSTRTRPPNPDQLTRVAGYGSSPVVTYEGEGTYFLDRIREGVWRLEVYPDAVDVEDPFEMPRRDKLVTRAFFRAWPMTISLPDLGTSFSAEPIASGNAATVAAERGRIVVRPGVYLLSGRGAIDRATLPARVANVGLAEFHAPPTDTLGTRVIMTVSPQYVTGRPATFAARVVSDEMPDTVSLWVRPVGRGWFTPFAMRRESAYRWSVTVPADSVREGPQELMVSVRHRDSTVTYPAGIARHPWSWDFHASAVWHTTVVGARVPLRLLAPADDAARLAFTRIGDAGRQGIFRVVSSAVTGEPALHLELPVVRSEDAIDDYTASLVVEDRIASRGETIGAATGLRIRLRGLAPRQAVHVSLMEHDGTTWSAAVEADSTWRELVVPLARLRATRGVQLPLGFPGRWNYWVGPAKGRGGAADRIRPGEIERLELSLRPTAGVTRAQGVEVESVGLVFP